MGLEQAKSPALVPVKPEENLFQQWREQAEECGGVF